MPEIKFVEYHQVEPTPLASDRIIVSLVYRTSTKQKPIQLDLSGLYFFDKFTRRRPQILNQTRVIKTIATLVQETLKTTYLPQFFFTHTGAALTDSGSFIEACKSESEAIILQSVPTFISAVSTLFSNVKAVHTSKTMPSSPRIPVTALLSLKVPSLAVNLEHMFINASKLGEFLKIRTSSLSSESEINVIAGQLDRQTVSNDTRPDRSSL